jgi:hypothetical protein
MRILTKDSQFPGRDMMSGPPKYESGPLPTKTQCSVHEVLEPRLSRQWFLGECDAGIFLKCFIMEQKRSLQSSQKAADLLEYSFLFQSLYFLNAF